jgi:hypothetical protein
MLIIFDHGMRRSITRSLLGGVRSIFAIGFPILCACFAPLQAQQIRGSLEGHVVDERGSGIEGASIIASGVGFDGWATSKADGSFHVSAAGAFVSVRRVGFKPRLIATSDLTTKPVRIQLTRGDHTIGKVPSCASLPSGGRAWVGGGLRVNAARRRYKGPVNGEHDAHWYFNFDQNVLHIVDGHIWHSGLPLESTLAASNGIKVRGWVFGDIVGLDLSGETKEGKRWRWVGAPINNAVEYSNSSQEAAAYFDQLIDTMCFQSVPVPKR